MFQALIDEFLKWAPVITMVLLQLQILAVLWRVFKLEEHVNKLADAELNTMKAMADRFDQKCNWLKTDVDLLLERRKK